MFSFSGSEQRELHESLCWSGKQCGERSLEAVPMSTLMYAALPPISASDSTPGLHSLIQTRKLRALWSMVGASIFAYRFHGEKIMFLQTSVIAEMDAGNKLILPEMVAERRKFNTVHQILFGPHSFGPGVPLRSPYSK